MPRSCFRPGTLLAALLIITTAAAAQVRIDTRQLFVPLAPNGKDATVQTTANLQKTALSHAAARAIFEAQPQSVELSNFPIPGTNGATLNLQRTRPVVDANSEIYTHTKNGKVPVKVRPVVSYKGTVNGNSESFVTLHYSEGNITGFVQEADGHRIMIGRDYSLARSQSATPHMIGTEAAIFGVDPLSRFICGSENLPVDDDAMRRKMAMPIDRKSGEAVQAEDLREFKMAVVLREDIDSVMKRRGDTDEEIVQYFIKIIASMAQVYEQDLNSYLYMAYFEKFTLDEPSGYVYDGRDPGSLLEEFSSDWSRRMNNVDRTLAHLYALIRPVGGGFVGGIAYLDQLCNKKNRGGYGVSTVYLNANNIPGDPNRNNAFVWDVFVAAHEMGHNIGAPHTHNCYWSPPIDTCQLNFNIDRTDGCFADPSLRRVIPGTIMSYCHLVNGDRTPLTFGPRAAERMRGWIKASPCVPLITRPLVQLTEPRGTDSYQPGEKMTIRWKSARVSNVNLLWGPAESGPWTSIASGLNADDELYTWTVPATVASEFWVRVEDAADANVNDTSLAKYRLAVPVVLDAPRGGERLGAGSTFQIRWTRGQGVTNVKIEFASDGENFETINASLNAAAFNWTVPTTATTKARIRVSALSSPSTPATSGEFSIGTTRFVLDIPEENAKLCRNQPNQYRWTHDFLEAVRIQYSTDNGANWRTATQQATITLSQWQIFSTNVNMRNVPVGTKVRLRVIDAVSEAVLATRDNLTIDTCDSIVSVDENEPQQAPFSITSLHPNPATTTVTCTIQSDIDTRATFLLVGTDGSEFVVGRQEGLRTGSQSIELPLTGLAAGAYQLVVRQGTMQVSAPLMITR